MSNSPWSDPQLTGTPLDYVPIDATVTKRSAQQEPNNFKAPILKRAAIAGLVAAVVVGVIMYLPYVALAAVAIGVILGAVTLAGKWADRLNALDGK